MEENSIEFAVTGMRCNGCVESVTRALSECEGVDEARVDLATGVANVRGSKVDRGMLEAAVSALGFGVGRVAAQ